MKRIAHLRTSGGSMLKKTPTPLPHRPLPRPSFNGTRMSTTSQKSEGPTNQIAEQSTMASVLAEPATPIPVVTKQQTSPHLENSSMKPNVFQRDVAASNPPSSQPILPPLSNNNLRSVPTQVASYEEDYSNQEDWMDQTANIPYSPGMIVYQPIYVPFSDPYGYSAYPGPYPMDMGYHAPYPTWASMPNYSPRTNAPTKTPRGVRSNATPFAFSPYYPGYYAPQPSGYFDPSAPTFAPNPKYMMQQYSEEEEMDDEIGNQSMPMSFIDLHQLISDQLATFGTCRVSWLNRLFCQASSEVEWNFCLELVKSFHQQNTPVTPETGTLLIKSACRLNIPEKALTVMQNPESHISPTLSGIHYLMINFSQKKLSPHVMDSFHLISQHNLKPNAKTYHILIRECSDNGSFEEAIKYGEECRSQAIVPNRVTYNILMNGYRKKRNPDQILALRSEMDSHNIELNDTTAKFTALAYFMKAQPEKAVNAFLQGCSTKTTENVDSIQNDKLESLCEKLLETGKEDDYFKNLVLDLMQRIQQKTPLPTSIRTAINQLKQQ